MPESKPDLKSAANFASYAAGLVGGDREKTHGTKLKNFDNIAAMWNAYLGIRKDPAAPLDAEDVGHMMVLLKTARTQHGSFNQDDYVDQIGYSACTAEIAGQLQAERVKAEVPASRFAAAVAERSVADGGRPRLDPDSRAAT